MCNACWTNQRKYSIVVITLFFSTLGQPNPAPHPPNPKGCLACVLVPSQPTHLLLPLFQKGGNLKKQGERHDGIINSFLLMKKKKKKNNATPSPTLQKNLVPYHIAIFHWSKPLPHITPPLTPPPSPHPLDNPIIPRTFWAQIISNFLIILCVWILIWILCVYFGSDFLLLTNTLPPQYE